MSLPARKITDVPLRHVHLKLEQETWERARQAAEEDRRSLANWLLVLVERALKARTFTLEDFERAYRELEQARRESEPPSP